MGKCSIAGSSSSVERTVWDREVAGATPVSPTNYAKRACPPKRSEGGISTPVV